MSGPSRAMGFSGSVTVAAAPKQRESQRGSGQTSFAPPSPPFSLFLSFSLSPPPWLA